MILVNGIMVELGAFPDKTSAMRYDPNDDNYTITWLYDGDHECMAVWYLVHHIRENCGAHTPICLNIPYLPNARMDRVKRRNEVFTLKWFAEFVNTMKFDKVSVLDPHSNVAPALINNVSVVQPDKYIWQAINWIGSNPMLCYPDEGAAKRYSDLIDADYVFGIKHRNWETGKIERFELTTPEKVYGRDVLIVDDICSRGGTFTHTAAALKAAGANDIYLYVTHCENTIFGGTVLTDGMISKVLTTDSIYRGAHENVAVTMLPRF